MAYYAARTNTCLTIWPNIRKQLPEAEVHVYGAYESQQFSELHSPKNGFIIKGYVDNISKAMQNARVCLAPLRFGAGLKGKLIDAMNNGTPCIMTDIAAEGMFSREIEPNGFISKDWTEFANFSMQLYNSINTWEEKQKNGYEIINSRFNKQKFKTTFIARIKEIRATLKNHRQSNFVGGMLHHHTLQSTKYMSKWIEAKNRNGDA